MRFLFTIWLLFTCFFSVAQHSLTGTVLNQKGEPVFAANVYLKATPERGTTTDFDGNFRLTTSDPEFNQGCAVVVISIKALP